MLMRRQRPERDFVTLDEVRARMRAIFEKHVDDPDIGRVTWLDNYSFIYFMKKTNEVLRELYEEMHR